MFKYMMAPSKDLLPPVKAWIQNDTHLRWSYHHTPIYMSTHMSTNMGVHRSYTEEKGYRVDKAFGMKSLKCFKKKVAKQQTAVAEEKKKSLIRVLFRRPQRAGLSVKLICHDN